MKLQILSLLSTSFIYLSKCQNIIQPTNYTLSYLQDVDMFQMKCTSDKDCPPYSVCDTLTLKNGEVHSICRFGDFLCPGRTDAYFMNKEIAEEPCLYVNSTMYDLDREAIKDGFSNDSTLILQTCSSYDNGCKTSVCSKNSDCLSGKGSDGSCVNNGEIYRCSTLDNVYEKYVIKCSKVSGMNCVGDSECYSNNCKSKFDYDDDDIYDPDPIRYCSLEKDRESNVLIVLAIVLVFFALILIPICYFTPKE